MDGARPATPCHVLIKRPIEFYCICHCCFQMVWVTFLNHFPLLSSLFSNWLILKTMQAVQKGASLSRPCLFNLSRFVMQTICPGQNLCHVNRQGISNYPTYCNPNSSLTPTTPTHTTANAIGATTQKLVWTYTENPAMRDERDRCYGDPQFDVEWKNIQRKGGSKVAKVVTQ